MSTANRVIKNTGFLYLKMGITVFVSLYSTRLILAALGEVDFGIFNVIGGSIAMMGFLNSTLANATQRFMSYAEGIGNLNHKIKIFNVSLVLHFFIGLITAALLIAFMPLLFDCLLNIPANRIGTAKIVYYTLIFSTILTIFSVPYEALLNAHENMFYYAIVGVLESFLRLGIAFVCIWSTGDILIKYSILMALIPIFTLSVMMIYCHKHYDESVIAISKHWDFSLVKKIAEFSGWNFLTAISSLFTVQGLSVALNHYFGSILNAAQGIATQVNGQLSAFSSNMMKALNPVIVKRTAEQNASAVSSITFTGSKFSAILILLFAIPVIIKIDYILSIWLKEVPAWTALFCQLQLIHTVIVQAANPLATAVYGNGNIKHYAIFKSITNILPLILTIVAFQFGLSPAWMYIFYISVMGVLGDWVITHYAQKECGLSAILFFKNVVLPLIYISIIMYIFGEIPILLFPAQNFPMLIICALTSTIGLGVSLCSWGLTRDERNIVSSILNRFRLKSKD